MTPRRAAFEAACWGIGAGIVFGAGLGVEFSGARALAGWLLGAASAVMACRAAWLHGWATGCRTQSQRPVVDLPVAEGWEPDPRRPGWWRPVPGGDAGRRVAVRR